jgi:hypothetical protein
MSPYRLGIWSIGLYSGNERADRDKMGWRIFDEGAKHGSPHSQTAALLQRYRHPIELQKALSLKHGAQAGPRTLTIYWQRTPSRYLGAMLLYCYRDSTFLDRTAPRSADAKINSRR